MDFKAAADTVKKIDEPERLLVYLDKAFADIAEHFSTIIINGVSEPLASEAHMAFPFTMDAHSWTKLVFANWQEKAESENMSPLEVTNFINGHFSGLAEAMADMDEFDVDNYTLPLSAEDSDFIDYYSGFDELEGWQKLMGISEHYGLSTKPFMLPDGKGRFTIALMSYSENQMPLRYALSLSQPQKGIHLN